MNIKILKFDPSSDKEGYYAQFQIKISEADGWTVMDLLDYISENHDPSLSYFKHSACNHGICGRCGVNVNGKTVLACTHVISDCEEIVIGPKSGRVLKDLITV